MEAGSAIVAATARQQGRCCGAGFNKRQIPTGATTAGWTILSIFGCATANLPVTLLGVGGAVEGCWGTMWGGCWNVEKDFEDSVRTTGLAVLGLGEVSKETGEISDKLRATLGKLQEALATRSAAGDANATKMKASVDAFLGGIDKLKSVEAIFQGMFELHKAFEEGVGKLSDSLKAASNANRTLGALGSTIEGQVVQMRQANALWAKGVGGQQVEIVSAMTRQKELVMNLMAQIQQLADLMVQLQQGNRDTTNAIINIDRLEENADDRVRELEEESAALRAQVSTLTSKLTEQDHKVSQLAQNMGGLQKLQTTLGSIAQKLGGQDRALQILETVSDLAQKADDVDDVLLRIKSLAISSVTKN